MGDIRVKLWMLVDQALLVGMPSSSLMDMMKRKAFKNFLKQTSELFLL
jgi:hypothetical protein